MEITIKKISILFAVLFITGCTSYSLTPKAKITSTTLPKSCSWPPIQLSPDAVSSFHWSNDGETINYHQETDTRKWFSYHLSDGKIKELPSYLDTTPTPKNVESDWGIMSYDDLFISSDRTFVVYTQINPDEEYTKDVYLTTKEKHATKLGRIKGLIDQHIWLNSVQQLILSIDWQSRWGAPEAYVYLVDLAAAKTTVLIPNTFENSGGISLLSVTPKEDSLLFVNYYDNDRFLRLLNIKNGDMTITKVHPPATFKWLPDHDQFLGIARRSDESQQIAAYIYDITNHSLRYITDQTINAQSLRNHSIEISPDLKSIVFIDDHSHSLYKIDCSQAVP